jgi:excisionase family DNA binding protein
MEVNQMKRRDLEQTAGDERLLNIEEAAAFLGVAVPTLRVWTRLGRVASHRLGKRVRYSVSDLKTFIAASRRPARLAVAATTGE